MIGAQDLVVGLVVVLVLPGAKKLPELAGSIGQDTPGPGLEPLTSMWDRGLKQFCTWHSLSPIA